MAFTTQWCYVLYTCIAQCTSIVFLYYLKGENIQKSVTYLRRVVSLMLIVGKTRTKHTLVASHSIPLSINVACTIYTITVLSYLGKENCCSPCRSVKNIHLKYIFAQTFLSRHLPVRSAFLLPPPSTSSSS